LTLFPAQKVKMFIDVMCKLNKPDTDETNVYRSAGVELWWCTVLWWTSGQWSSGLLCWSVLHQQQIKVVLWSAIRRAVDYTLLYRWPRQCTGVYVCVHAVHALLVGSQTNTMRTCHLIGVSVIGSCPIY